MEDLAREAADREKSLIVYDIKVRTIPTHSKRDGEETKYTIKTK